MKIRLPANNWQQQRQLIRPPLRAKYSQSCLWLSTGIKDRTIQQKLLSEPPSTLEHPRQIIREHSNLLQNWFFKGSRTLILFRVNSAYFLLFDATFPDDLFLHIFLYFSFLSTQIFVCFSPKKYDDGDGEWTKTHLLAVLAKPQINLLMYEKCGNWIIINQEVLYVEFYSLKMSAK